MQPCSHDLLCFPAWRGGAEEQAKCAELFDTPAAVQNAHLFFLSCARIAPHHSFFLCWVSLVASVLLLLLQEVSANPSGISSSREKVPGLPLVGRA